MINTEQFGLQLYFCNKLQLQCNKHTNHVIWFCPLIHYSSLIHHGDQHDIITIITEYLYPAVLHKPIVEYQDVSFAREMTC